MRGNLDLQSEAAARDGSGWHIRRRAWLALGLVAAVVILWGGYGGQWSWTGINAGTATLWDWLHLLLLPAAFGLLLALPLAVSLTPMLPNIRAAWGRHHTVVALAGLALFLVAVFGGYLGEWAWTGFKGNTLWDWLHLLLLPLLLPMVVVPRLTPLATVRFRPDEEHDEQEEHADEPLTEDGDLPLELAPPSAAALRGERAADP